MDGTPLGASVWPGRRRWHLAAVAWLVVGTLVTFDCLNVLHSESWSDLTRAPHLAAVSQGKASTGDPGIHQMAHPVSTVVPVAAALFVVWLLWGIATDQAPPGRAVGVRRRHAGGSPPVP